MSLLNRGNTKTPETGLVLGSNPDGSITVNIQGSVASAYPLSVNVFMIPLPGELVTLHALPGPSSNPSSPESGLRLYYGLLPLAVHGVPSQNPMEDSKESELETSGLEKTNAYSGAYSREQSSLQETRKNVFEPSDSETKVFTREGDLLIRSRSGSDVHFSTTPNEWKPNLILQNGQRSRNGSLDPTKGAAVTFGVKDLKLKLARGSSIRSNSDPANLILNGGEVSLASRGSLKFSSISDTEIISDAMVKCAGKLIELKTQRNKIDIDSVISLMGDVVNLLIKIVSTPLVTPAGTTTPEPSQIRDAAQLKTLVAKFKA